MTGTPRNFWKSHATRLVSSHSTVRGHEVESRIVHSIVLKRLLAISAILFFSGCAASGPRYKDLFEVFKTMGVPANRVKQFPALLVEAKNNQPVPGARLIVGASPKPVVFNSDDAGQILIWFDSELLRTNPPIHIVPDGVDLKMGFTMTLQGRPKSVQLCPVNGMKRYGDAGLAVFHQKGDESPARMVHSELARCRAGLESLLGIEPVRMAVILEPAPKQKNVLYLTIPPLGYDSIWLCFKERWESGEFMRITAHEWAESTLVSRFLLYGDPRNRFIGDGLADLVMWKLYGLPEDYRDRLSPERTSGVTTVDLLSAFQVIPPSVLPGRKLDDGMKKHGYAPGYALAFAFWHELSEKHGADLLPRFVKALARRQAPDADDAIEVLVHLTGDETIGDKLRLVNVDAARLRIERLMHNGSFGRLKRGDTSINTAKHQRRLFPPSASSNHSE